MVCGSKKGCCYLRMMRKRDISWLSGYSLGFFLSLKVAPVGGKKRVKFSGSEARACQN